MDDDLEFSSSVTYGLRILLDKEIAQGVEPRKARRLMLDKQLVVEARAANSEWLLKAEHGMQVARGHGFSTFKPARRASALGPREKLYFPEMTTGSGESRKRACIYDKTTGKAALALIENQDEQGRAKCLVWHVVVDFGPVGMPGWPRSPHDSDARPPAPTDALLDGWSH